MILRKCRHMCQKILHFKEPNLLFIKKIKYCFCKATQNLIDNYMNVFYVTTSGILNEKKGSMRKKSATKIWDQKLINKHS